MKKPIRVFYSELGERFYASAHYKIDGTKVVITGEKFDVTDDIGSAILRYGIEFTPIVNDDAEQREDAKGGA